METKTTCKLCNQIFCKRGNLERHLKLSCPKKKILLYEKNNIINKKNEIEMEMEIEKQKKNNNNRITNNRN